MSTTDPNRLPVLDTVLDLYAPLRLRNCPLVPTPRQEAFLRLLGPEVFYGGAAGGGKSIALLMAAAQYTDVPGYDALLVRPTLPELERPGGLIDLAHDWFAPTKAVWQADKRVYRFPGPGRSGSDGASIWFGYLDGQGDVGRYAGSSFSFLGFDELPQLDELTYHRMRRILRQATNKPSLGRSPDGLTLADVPVRIRATGNPGGPHHDWIKRYFVDPASRMPGVVYLASRWDDNPYLDRDAYLQQLLHLPPAERERLINGDWDVPDDGSMFQRDWFPIIDAAEVPKVDRAVRYWDLAASVPTPSNPDPDYTVGLRLDIDTDGIYYITGIVRRRLHAGQVEQLIAATAEDDGPGVQIWIEQEPGSQGEFFERHLRREVLSGYRLTMDRPTGPKEGRAYAVASAAEQGWVKLVAGPHTTEFLDELAQFPAGRHDDCVDALSGAHRALGNRQPVQWSISVPQGSIDDYGPLNSGRIWSWDDWSSSQY
jgi:predicted phage terminase large subunit-like protein